MIGQQQGSDWGYFGYDRLGSVRQVYDAAGAIVGATNYDPYGAPFETYTTLDSSLGFTGEFTDLNDLVFLRARYYSPSLGVFTSRDPFDGFMSRVMSRNGYSYTEGNPVNLTDPSGEFLPLLAALGATTLGGAAIGFITGAVFGGATALCTYDWAAAGHCGCQRQQQVLQMDRNIFIGQAMLTGAALGAVFGTFIGSGGVFSVAAGVVGTGLSSYYFMQSAWELIGDAFSGQGFNQCALLELILSGAGIVGGIGAIQHGINTMGQQPRLLPNNSAGSRQDITGGRGPASERGSVVGRHSGRDFHPENAGGEIRDLSPEGVRITNRGTDVVEAQLRRFADPLNPEEQGMLNRLRGIANGEIEAEPVDYRFYTHELRESVRYRNVGYPSGQPGDPDAAYNLWNDLHTATLEDYGLADRDAAGNPTLYHPDFSIR